MAAQTVERRLLGRGSVFTSATAVQLLAAAIVVPFLTRLLDPQQFGLIAVALVVRAVLTTIGSLGLPEATTREYFEGPDGPARSRTLILTAAAFATLAAAVADLTGPTWIEVFGNVEYSTAVRLVVWTAVPATVLRGVQAHLKAAQRAASFVAVTLVASAFAQALGVSLVAFVAQDVALYLGALLLGAGVAAGLGLILVRAVPRIPDRSLVGAALRYGGPTVVQTLALFAINAGDRVVVERALGLGPLGRYQVAYMVGGLGVQVLIAYSNAWIPIILAEDDEHRWESLAETAALTSKLVAMLTAALALIAPLALLVAAPPSYEPTELAAVSAVIAFSALPHSVFFACAPIAYQRRRTGLLAWSTGIAAVFNVVTNILVVPVLGLLGAALTTAATFLLLAATTVVTTSRLVQVPWRSRDRIRNWSIGVLGVAAAAVLPSTAPFLVLRGLAAGTLVLWAVRTAREGRDGAIRGPGILGRRAPHSVVFATFPAFNEQCLAIDRALDERGYRGRRIWLVDDVPEPEQVSRLGLDSDRHVFVPRTGPRGLLHYLRARYVFLTHAYFTWLPPMPWQTVVNVWHGMPIKAIGLLDDARDARRVQATHTVASSDLFRGIMGRALGVPRRDVLVVGNPRSDLLLSTDPRTVRHRLGLETGERIVLHVPTFRATDRGAGRVDGVPRADLLPHDAGERELLQDLLDRHRAVLLTKPHPAESLTGPDLQGRRIETITDGWLHERGLTLYEVLAAVDILLTDLSSVFVDFLVLDRPIVFLFRDLDEYRGSRRLLFEPFDEWAPGPVVRDVAGLVAELDRVLGGEDVHAAVRAERRRSLEDFPAGRSAHTLLDAIGFPVDGRTREGAVR